MDRREFEMLRDLDGKLVEGDIRFIPKRDASPQLVFEGIKVANDHDIDIIVYGRYNPMIRTTVFNFAVNGVGPICRFCVNGTLHEGAGRTHKHSLHRPTCPGRNLPHAVERIELSDLSPEEIWATVCMEARIIHTGSFHDPS